MSALRFPAMRSFGVWIVALCTASLPAQDERAAQLRERIDALITQMLEPGSTRDQRWEASDELARLATPAALPLVERYSSARPEELLEVRTLLPETLIAMGPGAERAAARLIDEVEQQDGATYWRALRLAAEVAPWHASLRARLQALEAPDQHALARMVKSAGYRGPEDLEYFARDVQRRWELLQARLTIDLDTNVDDLISVCRRGNAAEIEFAALLLARNDGAQAAVPVLADVLDHLLDPTNVAKMSWRAYEMKRALVEALVTIAPRDPRAVLAHLQRIDWHYPKPIRLRAARAIAALGDDAAPAVLGLIRFRNGWDDDDVMREVVTALGAIGPAAQPALEMLEGLVRDVKFDDELVAAAAAAIVKIRGR